MMKNRCTKCISHLLIFISEFHMDFYLLWHLVKLDVVVTDYQYRREDGTMCQELKDCVTFVTPLRWQTNFFILWNTRMAYSLAMIGWPYMKQKSQLTLNMSRQVININYYAILSRSFSSDYYEFRIGPHFSLGERRSRNRMVVGFTTSCAISAYHH
jgi:hypothetical protein